jgi:hypothetical protein
VKLRVLVTFAALLLLAVHVAWPDLKVDATTAFLVAVALLPWLATIIKSLELPGGFKIELQDIKAATDKVMVNPGIVTGEAHVKAAPSSVTASGIVLTRTTQAVDRLRAVAQNDPNLALIGVGIEIEKRLREIAEQRGIDTSRGSLGMLLQRLERAEALPAQVTSGLRELVALRNQAAHGATVSGDAAEWVLDAFPAILAALDRPAATGVMEGRK